MKLIILGDIHGNWNAANETVNEALAYHPDAKAVIQLGDLGDGWPTPDGLSRWHPNFNLPIFVVDGNHENFDALEAGNINPRLNWIRRGDTMVFDHKYAMFMGGATSPDKHMRILGRSWWPQESIKQSDVDNALSENHDFPMPLDMLFAHERADIFPIPDEWKLPIFEGTPGASDRYALSLICKRWQPRWYFHGHWHVGDIRQFSNTMVVAFPNIDDHNKWWGVFDGDKLITNW